jgi:MFS family permease
MGSLTQIVGPVTAGFLYDTAGLASTQVFALSAVLAVVAIAVGTTLLLRPPHRSDGRGTGQQPRAPFLQAVGGVMRQPAVPHAMLASVAVLTTIDLLIAYLPAYGEANGIPAATVGLMLGARAAGSVLSRALMLPMLRRWSRRQLLVLATAVPCGTVAVLPTTTYPLLLVGLLSIAGFGLGLGQPLSMSWIADAVPREVRGTALGVRITGNRLGQFLVPLGVGAVAGATGVAAIFVVAALTLGASSLVVARAPTTDDP